MESIVSFVNTGPKITVGDYEIRQLKDGSLWFEVAKGESEGEGMQVSVGSKALQKFADLVDSFYGETF